MYTLAATGDFMLQHRLRPTPDDSVSLHTLLAGADDVFANLEVVLTSRTAGVGKYVHLRCDPALAGELAAVGVTVVTLANNHACDFGYGGLTDTMQALRGVGVASVGAGMDESEAMAPTVVLRSGVRVAFMGFATTLPAGFAAGRGVPGVAPIRVVSRFVVDTATLEESPGTAPYVETLCLPGEAERAEAAVEAAKRDADLVIVALHWGVPFGWVAAMQDELADYQRPLAHGLVDAGADAVVGHHPHVLHGVEFYKGRPICYSLGNFVFHPWEDPVGGQQYLSYPNYAVNPHRGRESRLGGVARLSWENRTTRAELAVLPYRLDNDGEPVPATASGLDEIRTRLGQLSARFNVGFSTRGGSLIAKSSGN